MLMRLTLVVQTACDVSTCERLENIKFIDVRNDDDDGIYWYFETVTPALTREMLSSAGQSCLHASTLCEKFSSKVRHSMES